MRVVLLALGWGALLVPFILFPPIGQYLGMLSTEPGYSPTPAPLPLSPVAGLARREALGVPGRSLELWVLPEAGHLVAAVPNAVFVRVTEGLVGLPGVMLRVGSQPAAKTDGDGLACITVTPRQTPLALSIEAEFPGGTRLSRTLGLGGLPEALEAARVRLAVTREHGDWQHRFSFLCLNVATLSPVHRELQLPELGLTAHRAGPAPKVHSPENGRPAHSVEYVQVMDIPASVPRVDLVLITPGIVQTQHLELEDDALRLSMAALVHELEDGARTVTPPPAARRALLVHLNEARDRSDSRIPVTVFSPVDGPVGLDVFDDRLQLLSRTFIEIRAGAGHTLLSVGLQHESIQIVRAWSPEDATAEQALAVIPAVQATAPHSLMARYQRAGRLMGRLPLSESCRAGTGTTHTTPSSRKLSAFTARLSGVLLWAIAILWFLTSRPVLLSESYYTDVPRTDPEKIVKALTRMTLAGMAVPVLFLLPGALLAPLGGIFTVLGTLPLVVALGRVILLLLEPGFLRMFEHRYLLGFHLFLMVSCGMVWEVALLGYFHAGFAWTDSTTIVGAAVTLVVFAGMVPGAIEGDVYA